MDIIKEFVRPELVGLIPMLYLLGIALKKTSMISDKFIPSVLGIVGIVLAMIYTLATVNIVTYQDALMSVFTALTQGVLCAGCSVYFNQLFVVQVKKEDE